MQIKTIVKKIAAIGLLTILCTSCKRPKLEKRKVYTAESYFESKERKSHKPMITVWIHGTRLFKTIANPLDEYIHAAPPTGLTPVTNLSDWHRILGIAKALVAADPSRFDLDSFYAFGWSGDLRFDEREAAARKLYQELKQLIASRKNWFFGQTPKIRLITHSHGSNVALNLAKMKEPHDGFVIDEAIFLAGPVQRETKEHVKSPVFKKIYSLYSTLDSIQIMDPQGMYKTEHNKKRHVLFSQRRLPADKKMRQAKIKINGHGLPHIGFILKGFIRLIPTILDELDAWELESPNTNNDERLLILQT